MPKRIQRSRVKGSRLPPNTICVTRPGKWGNWFTVGLWFRNVSGDWYVTVCGDSPHFGNEQVQSLEHSLALFEHYAICRLKWQPTWLDPLCEADYIACWCKEGEPCHANILLKLIAQVIAEREQCHS